jgi:hypothetical protein
MHSKSNVAALIDVNGGVQYSSARLCDVLTLQTQQWR